MGVVGEESGDPEETWVMGLGTTTKCQRNHGVRKTLSYLNSFERLGYGVSHSRVVPPVLDGNEVLTAAIVEDCSKKPEG